MAVGPRAVGDVAGVELTQRNHRRLLRVAADRVTVGVDVHEPVEREAFLLGAEHLLGRGGIPQPDVPERLGTGGDVAFGEIGCVLEALRLDVVGNPERVACHLDVALDVRLLTRELVRLHDETLDDRRIDRADDERDERPEPDRDDREHPALAEDVGDEETAAAAIEITISRFNAGNCAFTSV